MNTQHAPAQGSLEVLLLITGAVIVSVIVLSFLFSSTVPFVNDSVTDNLLDYGSVSNTVVSPPTGGSGNPPSGPACGNNICESGELVSCQGDCPATTVCGDGFVSGSEACDRTGDVGCGTGQRCNSACTACFTPSSGGGGGGGGSGGGTGGPPSGSVCGNAVCESGETSASCSNDCPATSVCGDGTISGNEVCDGGTQACVAVGGYAGSQSCLNDCSGYATCTSQRYCGDGARNGNEECDGSDFGAYGDGINQCSVYNASFTSGNLSCSSTCQFDTSTCNSTSGNDVTPPVISTFSLAPGDGSNTITYLADDPSPPSLPISFVLARSTNANAINAMNASDFSSAPAGVTLISLNGASPHLDGGLTNNTVYYYKLRACDNAPSPNCGISSTISGTPLDTTPPTLSGFGVTPGNTQNTLSLTTSDASSPPLQFRMARALTFAAIRNITISEFDSPPAGVSVFTISNTPHVDSGLTNNTAYFYRIRVCDSAATPNCAATGTIGSTPQDTTPPALSNFTITAGNTQNTIGFSASDPVPASLPLSYRLARATNQASIQSLTIAQFDSPPGGVTILSPAASPFTDTGLTNGITYYYMLRVCDNATTKNCTLSGVGNSTSQDSTPPTISSFSVSGGNTQATATFSASDPTPSSLPISYRLARSTNLTAIQNMTIPQYANPPAGVTILSPSTSPFTDTGLTNNTTYYYRLRVCDNAGTPNCTQSVIGNVTPQDTTAPSISTFTATPGIEQVSISYSASDPAPASLPITYRIARSTNQTTIQNLTLGQFDSPPGGVTIISPTTNPHLDAGLTGGVTYYYKLRACDNATTPNCGASSSVSSTPSAATDTIPPSVPSNVSATPVSSSSIRITWNASTDNIAVTGYRVDVSTASNFSSFVSGWNNQNVNNVLTIDVTGLSASTTYYARVRAYDAAGNTSGSSTVTNTTTSAAASTGWTTFSPSADSRIIYVSSSAPGTCQSYSVSEVNTLLGGNVFLPSGAISRACGTIAAAKSLMRTGFPDWMLLKKGDTFNEGIGNLGNNGNVISGRSISERALISSYGTGARPLLLTGTNSGVISIINPITNTALVGLHFWANTYTGQGFPAGMSFISTTTNLLLEDNYVQAYGEGIVFDAGNHSNVSIRRNVVADSYTTGADHSKGIYLGYVSGVLLEENVISDNGWNLSVPASTPTVFRRNVYIQSGPGSVSGVIFRGNIITGTEGVQARTGGVIENNLFIRNSIGLLVGGGHTPQVGGVTASVKNNVILEGADISPSLPRGMGLIMNNVTQSSVESNILAYNAGNQPWAISIEQIQDFGGTWRSVQNTVFSGNVIYDWRQPSTSVGQSHYIHYGPTNNSPPVNIQLVNNRFQSPFVPDYLYFDGGQIMQNPQQSGITLSSNNTFYTTRASNSWMNSNGSITLDTWKARVGDTTSTAQQVSFPDATRTIATYNSSVGGTASYDHFKAQIRAQSKDNWRTEYTADAINDYFRTGFGVSEAP